MSEDVERPDWLVPGAEVLAIKYPNYGAPIVTKTRIKKVATKTFSIEDSDNRFRVSDQTHYATNSWGSPTRVVHPGSKDAQKALSQARQQRLENQARDACTAWHRDRSEQNRVAAIEALQALAPEDES